jgi:hypothetical protein
MLYNIVDFLALLLPTVIGIGGVLIGIKLTKGESHNIWWTIIIIMGIGTSILTWKSQSHAREDHKYEINQQKQAVESLRIIINANEIRNAGNMGYLRAKLEDSERWNEKLSQFAPAVARLAETTADFTRKQYEAKLVSDKELYNLTMDVVKRIRDFYQKYRALSDKQNEERMAISRITKFTEAERQNQWIKETQKSTQFYLDRDNEFRSSILPDALYARQELSKRKLSEPNLSPMNKSTVNMVLRGMLAGPYPELELADYLELMAKPISGK